MSIITYIFAIIVGMLISAIMKRYYSEDKAIVRAHKLTKTIPPKKNQCWYRKRTHRLDDKSGLKIDSIDYSTATISILWYVSKNQEFTVIAQDRWFDFVTEHGLFLGEGSLRKVNWFRRLRIILNDPYGKLHLFK